MPDSTPTPPPEPEKNKRSRGVLNQAQIQALTKAEQISTCALKATYAPLLADRAITAEFITALQDDIKAARKKNSEAVQNTTDKEGDSIGEDRTEKELLRALQEVQSAAKQKYGRQQPEMLPHYFIGTRLNANRPMLEQSSQGIIEKLGTDTLPGIKPAKVQNLVTLRQKYLDSNAEQGGKQSDATRTRRELEAMVQTITDRRVEIQHAADAEWPYTNDSNQGVRKEFFLPLSMPFNG